YIRATDREIPKILFPNQEDISSLFLFDLFLLLPAVSVWPGYRFLRRQNGILLCRLLFCLQCICLPSVRLSFCKYFLLFLPCPFPFSFAMLPIVFFSCFNRIVIAQDRPCFLSSSPFFVCCIRPVFQLPVSDFCHWAFVGIRLMDMHVSEIQHGLSYPFHYYIKTGPLEVVSTGKARILGKTLFFSLS